VGSLDGTERPPQRQLPAHVRLRLDMLSALLDRQHVQRAAGAAREAGPVGEDAALFAADLMGPGLALPVVVELDPVLLLHRATRVELPVLGRELGDEPRGALLVLLAGEMRAQRATADVRGAGVDAAAAGAEDARVRGGQPGQVGADDLALVVGVRELDPR